jgi:hypothetical protein
MDVVRNKTQLHCYVRSVLLHGKHCFPVAWDTLEQRFPNCGAPPPGRCEFFFIRGCKINIYFGRHLLQGDDELASGD